MLNHSLANWLDYLIAILAVYRLTRMAWVESGPFDVVQHVRTFAYNRIKTKWVNEGLNCPYCISFWMAIVVYFLPWPVVVILALSGAVCLFFEYGER